jgi:hypothetical protein
MLLRHLLLLISPMSSAVLNQSQKIILAWKYYNSTFSPPFQANAAVAVSSNSIVVCNFRFRSDQSLEAG